MKSLATACLGAALLLGAHLPAHADTFNTKRCVNMGNALDAPNEGDWGHTIEASSFKAIADAGFDTVRIPVRWSAHTKGAPDYKIDEAFFSRVTDVINQALANNLQIVLNIHHFEELNEAPAENAAKFVALWEQIATRYKDWSGINSFPTIPSIEDPNQVYTFHYYDPFKFTHQKTSWTDLKNSGTVGWGGSADKAELNALMKKRLMKML